MTIAAFIALFGWIPFVLALFLVLPARRAILVAYMGAWMFLPMAGVRLTALPDFGKIMAANLAVLLGVALFDAGRLLTFRPRLIDLPIAAWFICPFFSSLINGLGAYDGASSVFGNVMTWGIPYLIGRLYFSDLPSLRELAIAIFIGGLIYVPFCLWEIRMSPQLHAMIYGGKNRIYPEHSLRRLQAGCLYAARPDGQHVVDNGDTGWLEFVAQR